MTVLPINRKLHRHRVKNVRKLVERVTVVSVHGAVIVVAVAVADGDGDAVTDVDAVQGQLPLNGCGGGGRLLTTITSTKHAPGISEINTTTTNAYGGGQTIGWSFSGASVRQETTTSMCSSS